jgi:hypothetical protein
MPSGSATRKVLAGDDSCRFQFIKSSVQKIAVSDRWPLLLSGEMRPDGFAREPFRDGAEYLRFLVIRIDFKGGTLDFFRRVKAGSSLALDEGPHVIDGLLQGSWFHWRNLQRDPVA